MQSMLPALRGRNRCSSQPGMPSRPRMQSLVRHDAQTAGSRTLTSSGETSDCTKLNWPIGTEVFAEGGAAEEAVDDEGRREIARASHAVHHGLSHRANAS